MRLNDAIVGVVLVIFAFAVITCSTTFPSLHGQEYGPSLFPTLIGYCLAACGLVLIVRGIHARRRQKQSATAEYSNDLDSTDSNNWIEWGDWVNDRSSFINMLLVPGLLIAYVLLSDWIGFIPLSILILSILLIRLGSAVFPSLLIACASTTLLYLLFVRVLLVPLPPGLLLRWIG